MVLKQWEQDAIIDIATNFNFKKVADVMAYLDWRWAIRGNSAKLEIPSEYTIRKEAMALVKKACEEKQNITTGGFCVIYDKKEKFLELGFVIESWYFSKEQRHEPSKE